MAADGSVSPAPDGTCATATDTVSLADVDTQCAVGGFYNFSLAPGTYVVRLAASGFPTQWATHAPSSPQFSASGAQPFTIADGEIVYFYTALVAGPIITGTVKNTDGQPLTSTRFCVTAMQGSTAVATACPGTEAWAPGSYAMTAPNGLVAGTYTLAFAPEAYASPLDYAPQWYPGGIMEQGDATTVTVGADLVVADLTVTRGGSISGRVTGADTGQGLGTDSLACFFAYPVGTHAYAHSTNDDPVYVKHVSRTCSSTFSDGAYVLKGLPAGDYKVFFDGRNGPYFGEWSGDAATQEAASVVAVTAGATTTGVDATLQRGATITGRVTRLSTGAPLSGSSFYVEVFNAAGELVSHDWFVGSDGVFHAYQLKPGQYRVGFFTGIIPSGEQWFNRAGDLAHAQVVTISTAGQTVTGINQAIDDVAPTAVLTAPTAVSTLASTVTLTWTASDAGTGAQTYDVRYRRAAWNGNLPTTYVAPAALQGRTTRSAAVAVAAGFEYCFQVRARDKVRNVGAWSAQRCIGSPLDDRSLAISSGWSRAASSSFYKGTYTSTTKLNASMTLAGARFARVGVVVTKCPTCGTVGVYSGNTLLGKINLAASTTMRKVVVLLPKVSLRTATITVKILSSGKPVQVDGLLVSKV